MSVTVRLLYIWGLIVISSFFSMAEISLAGARKIKLQLMAESGDKKARKVLDLQDSPGNFFTSVQIGMNIVALLAGIIGDGIFSPYLKNYIDNETIIFLISFIFVTGVFIEFADLIPKRIAMIYPEKVALLLVNKMVFVNKVLYPVILIFNSLANLVFKIFKLSYSREDNITYDDIIAIVNAGAQAGTVKTQEQSFIQNVFELEERWVSSAMTTRDEIVYFKLTDSEEDIKEKIEKDPHSRFLVCEDSIDSIYGYVDSKFLLSKFLKGEFSNLKNLKEITNRSLLIIPNTLSLSEMLDRFNATMENFAVILNEYGHVVGLITLQDVISTLMGDLDPLNQEEYIIKRDNNSWLIDGLTPIEDVKKALNIDNFTEEDTYETIAGFMFYMLKNIPKKGASVEYLNYSFEVVDVDNFKIDQLLVIKKDHLIV
ncbi:HlyC/CorC family transporter [Thiospirochaeta perfilievii]|uniref:Polyamine export protein n=1 Tax=Thiospirochaeta perfilievii TaxID=252967 RepID=A0A5C1QFE1_9SPIO|nr:hemolysin family protein [Thiospirochaeta perfilievii]QEN05306.1 HlyC/CorC family transporter [Thiospirochaeta perfilievii]